MQHKLLSKEQYDELERIRTLFAEIEEIEFSPYEADDISDPNVIRGADMTITP